MNSYNFISTQLYLRVYWENMTFLTHWQNQWVLEAGRFGMHWNIGSSSLYALLNQASNLEKGLCAHIVLCKMPVLDHRGNSHFTFWSSKYSKHQTHLAHLVFKNIAFPFVWWVFELIRNFGNVLLVYRVNKRSFMTWGGHQRASGCHEEPRERQRMTFHLLERPQCFKVTSTPGWWSWSKWPNPHHRCWFKLQGRQKWHIYIYR